jgi:mannan endo-1,4-beta-mannosidase
MIDYSPSRVEYGTTSTAVEDAIAYDKNETMVHFVWHWNAPTGLINNDTYRKRQLHYTFVLTFV